MYGTVDENLLTAVIHVPDLSPATFLVDIKVDENGNLTLVKQYTQEHVSFISGYVQSPDSFDNDGSVIVE